MRNYQAITFRWKNIFIAGAILTLGIVSYLLFSHYRSQVELNERNLDRMSASLENWAEAVSYYLQERQRDVAELATGSVVKSYFVNRSLGMSRQYGLRETRRIIERRFGRLVQHAPVPVSAVFSAIVLFDEDGEVLVSSLKPVLDGLELTAISSGFPTAGGITITPCVALSAEGSFLQITVPVQYDHERVGMVVGLVSLPALHERFFSSRTNFNVLDRVDFVMLSGDSSLLFAPQDTGLSRESVAELASYPSGSETRVFRRLKDEGQAYRVVVLYKQGIENVLDLAWVVDDGILTSTVHQLLYVIIFSILAVVAIGSIVLSAHQYANSLALSAKLDAAEKNKLDLEKKHTSLVKEVEHRQSIESQLQRGEALLRSLLDSTPDLIFYKSCSLIYEGCNSAFSRFVGILSDDLVGRTDSALPKGLSGAFGKQDKMVLSRGVQARYEIFCTGEDGSDCNLEIIKTPSFSFDGSVIALIGVCRDITERKRFEEALKTNEERLSLVIHATGVGVWDWHIASGKVFFNERWAEMAGYNLAELEPLSIETWLELAHPEDLKVSETLLQKHFSGQTDYYDCECRMRHKNGHWLWIQDCGRVVEWAPDGTPVRMTGTHTDITRRKAAEEELKLLTETLEQRVEQRSSDLNQALSKMVEQEKLASMGHLAAGIAHELNNPINFVRTNLATLHEYFNDMQEWYDACRTTLQSLKGSQAAAARSRLEEFEGQIRLDFILDDLPALFSESEKGFERVANIIGAMRNFSRQVDGEIFAEVNINDCIRDALIITRNEYKYCADIKLDLTKNISAWAIREQLGQVFLNLIVNAAHSIRGLKKEGMGTITIRTWKYERMVCCSVQDDGRGIANDSFNRLFEPFFTTKPPGQGTGLGLSISYDIVVNKHRGELLAENCDQGGACFTLKLPVDNLQ